MTKNKCLYCDNISNRKICSTHQYRIKHGIPVDQPILNIAKYSAVHKRLERSKGSASNYSCVDCQQVAAQWSLPITATDITSDSSGAHAGCPYTRNINEYEPRCRSCHRTYDFKHNLLAIPRPSSSTESS